MTFKIPSFESIREQILRDFKSLNPAADVAADSDYYVRASSIASCASGQYAHQAWIVRQIFPDTADTEFLELHCSLRHIFRKDATGATVAVSFTGTAATLIPKDTEIKANNADVVFTTLSDVIIDTNGVASASARAIKKGLSTNISAQSGQCLSAPAGIDSGVLLSAGTGGTDVETDAALLSRLLDRLRNPPAGGNANDYKQWALSVDGVDKAYVYPLRRGLGTVDIVITTNDGLPSAATIDTCQKYIDSVRPVTAKNATVLAPTIDSVAISYKSTFDGNDVRIKQAVEHALRAYFAVLAPNDVLIVSKIDAAISDTVGIVDHQLLTPSANVQPQNDVITWYKLGTVSVSAL